MIKISRVTFYEAVPIGRDNKMTVTSSEAEIVLEDQVLYVKPKVGSRLICHLSSARYCQALETQEKAQASKAPKLAAAAA